MKKISSLIGIILIVSCGGRQSQVDRVVEDGIEVVLNHTEPYKLRGEPKSVDVKEVSRIDLETREIAELGISDVDSFEVDSAGNIYFLAGRASESILFKFNSLGEYVTSFGTRGQGPGEIENPTFFCISEKDKIVVTDLAKSKFCIFSQEGRFIEEFRLPLRLRAVFPLENGNYLGLRQSIDREGFEPSLQSSLCLYNSKFMEIKQLDRQSPSDYMTSNKINGIPQIFHWEVHDGKIYTGNGRRGYEILVYELDGKLERKIRKKHKPVEVSEECKRLFLSQVSENDPWRKRIFFSNEMPPFNEFFVDDVGRLYVISYEKYKSSREYICDIFNDQGISIMRQNLKISLSGQDLLLSGQVWGVRNHIVAKKGRLYHLRTKESGYKELMVYKTIWER